MSNTSTFEKILIANRGEIAVRVIRSAKAMGYRTVAVYSEADADAPHVLAADEAVCIGAAAVGESYLVADKIIQAAKLTGAGAVHPGYGFLSENSQFANSCEQNDIEFIGPPSAAIELMGSKRLSKIAMIKAGVPCIKGYEGDNQDVKNLIDQAKKIGFPLMVKASAGGGGRGMRLVLVESELEEQIKTARSEAENAFGSGELILEQAVIKPRHIEIQVFADKYGNAVYLGERDCSIQRRHQKVVEEAPSPFVDPELRQRMGEAAVQAAKACNYVGAGTVEFLVDSEKNFYFLEMNTRLQVEHPVTELVTGTDLVEWQIKVAAGQQLPKTQDDVSIAGHAMEVRLYAEDPTNQFMPQTGIIHRWSEAQGEGVRIDSGIRSGQTISPFYDPMLAKIIAYGSDREEARRRLIRAVEESTLFGVTVNSEFLCEVLRHQSFIDGAATTAFIGEDFANNATMQSQQPSVETIALAAIVCHLKQEPQKDFSVALSGWSNTSQAPWPYTLTSGEKKWELSLAQDDEHYEISLGDDTASIEVVALTDDKLTFVSQGVRRSLEYQMDENHVFMRMGGAYYQFDDNTHAAIGTADAAGSGLIKASMDGAIIDVLVEAGQTVEKGQTLVILEAMKMEHPLKSDVNGVVAAINTSKGDQVKLRQLLVEVTADESE
jgi:geranyl-CoA carboxylase alpha subunit